MRRCHSSPKQVATTSAQALSSQPVEIRIALDPPAQGGTFSANSFTLLSAGGTNTSTINIGGTADEYEPWLASHQPDARVHAAAPTDCFVQLYTSGTTGFPKGAMLTHHGMLAHARNVAATQTLGADSRVQVAMPLFHVGGDRKSVV